MPAAAPPPVPIKAALLATQLRKPAYARKLLSALIKGTHRPEGDKEALRPALIEGIMSGGEDASLFAQAYLKLFNRPIPLVSRLANPSYAPAILRSINNGRVTIPLEIAEAQLKDVLVDLYEQQSGSPALEPLITDAYKHVFGSPIPNKVVEIKAEEPKEETPKMPPLVLHMIQDPANLAQIELADGKIIDRANLGGARVKGPGSDIQDSGFIGSLQDKDIDFVCVCDGASHPSGGKIASQTATYSMLKSFRDAEALEWENPERFLRAAVATADQAILDKLAELGFDYGNTTIAAALRIGDTLHCINVGDSRIYSGYFGPEGETKLSQITQDDSWAMHQFLNGNSHPAFPLSPEQTEQADEAILNGPADARRRITQALGPREEGKVLKPNYVKVTLRDGEFFLAQSDGLHGQQSITKTKAILAENRDSSVSESTLALVQAAKAQNKDDVIILMGKYMPTEKKTSETTWDEAKLLPLLEDGLPVPGQPRMQEIIVLAAQQREFAEPVRMLNAIINHPVSNDSATVFLNALSDAVVKRYDINISNPTAFNNYILQILESAEVSLETKVLLIGHFNNGNLVFAEEQLPALSNAVRTIQEQAVREAADNRNYREILRTASWDLPEPAPEPKPAASPAANKTPPPPPPGKDEARVNFLRVLSQGGNFAATIAELETAVTLTGPAQQTNASHLAACERILSQADASALHPRVRLVLRYLQLRRIGESVRTPFVELFGATASELPEKLADFNGPIDVADLEVNKSLAKKLKWMLGYLATGADVKKPTKREKLRDHSGEIDPKIREEIQLAQALLRVNKIDVEEV